MHLTKSKIAMLRVGWGGGRLVEFDADFKFAKIQNWYAEGGLIEFDAEFKFAKIQLSYVWWGGGLVEPTFNF